MGMKVSDFYVLAVPGIRTEWSEINNRVDLDRQFAFGYT